MCYSSTIVRRRESERRGSGGGSATTPISSREDSRSNSIIARRHTTNYRLVSDTSVADCVPRSFHTTPQNSFCYPRVVLRHLTPAQPQSNHCAVVQMPLETEVGEEHQESSRAHDTIVTTDAIPSKGGEHTTLGSQKFATSEPTYEFDALLDRYMPCKPVTITTSQARGTIVATYNLPRDLYNMLVQAPAMLPFESFIYSTFRCTFKVIVNANKFQCGKLIVTYLCDAFKSEEHYTNIQASLARQHVILDLAANNEGELDIPFRFHRPFIRNVSHTSGSNGVNTGLSVTVYIQVLSSLQSGPDSPANITIRPYVKMPGVQFAGLSYRAVVQMDTIAPIAGASIAGALKPALIAAEKALSQMDTRNRDKPIDQKAQVIIPRVRMNFPSGKGLSDAEPLRLNPSTQTPFTSVRPEINLPQTTLDIARIWGLKGAFRWDMAQAVGTEIHSLQVDPVTRDYNQTYNGNPTPLEYVTSMYMFWSGTIDLRFDFVSTSFHTGAVSVSVEFSRPVASDPANYTAIMNTYTKTFHLGDQRSFEFTVPYIYDTTFRRSTKLPFNPMLLDQDGSEANQSTATAVYTEVRTKVSVRVVNQLRPIPSAPQGIEVLIYMRAGSSYMLHGLCQSSMYVTYEDTIETEIMKAFPKNYGRPPSLKRGNSANTASRPLILSGTRGFPAQTQMDHTDNFSGGLASVHQFGDSQIDIKDILRRPCLLIVDQKVEGWGDNDTHGFWIPLMPPSRLMAHRKAAGADGETNSIFSDLIGQTPQAQLMNLFRFWRGSMRYTIVFEGLDTPNGSLLGETMYVTHVPHSGARLIGNFAVGTYAHADRRPVHACGLSTVLMSSYVNPTITVETPFDTENDWCLTFENRANENYSWRDKGDTNVGHLVLTSKTDCRVSVWWSAGDDFEVANFYGIPPCRAADHWLMKTDNVAQTQSDWSLPESCSQLLASARGLVKPANVARALAYNTPYIGPGLVAASAVDTITDVADKAGTALNAVASASNSISQSAANIQSFTDEILMRVDLTLSQTLGWLKSAADTFSLIRNLILDVVIIVADKSWVALGTAIVRFLSSIPSISISPSDILAYGARLSAHIQRLFRGTAETQIDDSSTLAGVIVGLLGVMLKVRIDAGRYSSYFQNLGVAFLQTGTMSYLNQVLRFVGETFDLVKEVVLDTLGFVAPESAALKMLAESDTTLQQFVRDAQMVTSEMNASLLSSPEFRTRFFVTVMQAYQYQAALSCAPPNMAKPVLSKLVSDVIRVANEKSVDLTCCPVRFEPYVFAIEGPPKIGKSFVTENLAQHLMQAVNFQQPCSGITYTRQPSGKYWSSYRDQPTIVYDDWMNMTTSESVETSVQELFYLKSTCAFIPEMAHLEDKRIHANPLLVILNTNDAYPSSVRNCATTPDAVFRRRERVFAFALKPEYHGVDLRDLTEFESENCVHLEVRMYKDVVDKDAGKYEKVLSYVEFRDYLAKEFTRYYNREQNNVARRLKRFYQHLHGTRIEDINFNDAFQVFYAAQARVLELETRSSSWIPSEMLEESVRLLRDHIATRPQEDHIVGPPIQNPFTQATIGDLADFCTAIFNKCVSSLEWVSLPIGSLCARVSSMIGPTCPRGVCVVCRDETNIHVVCQQSVAVENPHYVCRSCWDSWANHRHHCCPLCSDTHMVLALNTSGYCLSVFIRWLALHYDQAKHWISTLPIPVVLRLIAFTSCLTEFFSTGRISMATCAVALVTHAAEGVRQALVQSDDFFEANPTEWPVTQEEEPEADRPFHTAFHVEVVDSVLQRITQPLEQDQCFHHDVLRDPNSVRYESADHGWWVTAVRVEGETYTVRARDRACQQESCPFRDAERLREFLNTYKDLRVIQIRRQIQSYLNGTLHSTSDRLTIPLALRPTWMQTHKDLVPKNWWDYLSETLSPYKFLIVTSISVAAAISSLLMGVRFWNTANGLCQFDPNYDAGATRQIRSAYRRVSVRNRERLPLVQANQIDDNIRTAVAANYYVVTVQDGTTVRKRMNVLGLYGRVALMPKHYVRVILTAIENKLQVYVQPANHATAGTQHLQVQWVCSSTDFISHPDTDLAIARFPRTVPLLKDIRKFFWTEDDLASQGPAATGTVIVPPTATFPFISASHVDILGYRESVPVLDADGSSMPTRHVLTYTFSESGACGAALFQDNRMRPITSLHTAGFPSGEGYGVIVTQELIDEMDKFKELCTQAEEGNLIPVAEAEKLMVFDTGVHVDYLGAVPRNRVPYLAKTTNIIPSLIHRKAGLAPFSEPCIQHVTDPRYDHPRTPLWYGARKHGLLTRDFTVDELTRVRDALFDGVFSRMKPLVVAPKILSPEEAVVGKPGVPFYDPIKLDTSAGYPWTLEANRTDKRAWITPELTENGQTVGCHIDSRLLQELHRKRTLRQQGIVPFTIFCDTLKDERKLSEKVRKAGATRVFCACPIDYTIAQRQQTLHFTSALMAARLQVNCAIGINVHGPEWAELAMRLANISTTNIVNLDYSNFGPAFNTGAGRVAANIMSMWNAQNVEAFDEVEFACLMEESLSSVHIAGSTVYRQFAGSPSGAPHTTPINSLTNLALVYLAWQALCTEKAKSKHPDIWAVFRHNVFVCVYGDDMIMSVSDEFADIFNMQTITEYFAQYGVAATGMSKDGSELPKFISLAQAEFLKRKFVNHPEFPEKMLAPLDWRSVMDITQWIWKSPNKAEATLENIMAALMEAYPHGREIFKDFKTRINHAIPRTIAPITITWEDLDQKWLSGNFPDTLSTLHLDPMIVTRATKKWTMRPQKPLSPVSAE